MKIKGFLIDLDGVLTRDEEFTPISGAIEFINFLVKGNIPFIIATSNSRYSPEEIAYKLVRKGFNLKSNQIVSPLTVAPEVLRSLNINKIYVIGSQNLKKFLEKENFHISKTPKVDAVIVGLDKKLNFTKIKIATTALKTYNALLFALNKNILSKDDDGLLFPGVGTIAKMFSLACQCNENFTHFGKMGKEYNKLVFSRLGIKEMEHIAIISDDIYIDLKGYKQLGLKTIFVTTGKYDYDEALNKNFVDIIVNNLMEIPRRIKIY